MRIAIIGAGNVGTALGGAWARTGHEITYGVRDPSRAVPGWSTTSVASSVASSEVAVLTTPWAAVADVLGAAGDFGGRILVDVTNPIGPGFRLAAGHTSSGAEEVAKLAIGARVVKAFNTTGLENMMSPRYGAHPLVMPVAGDDAAAVTAVSQLATDLGFEAVGLPGLARARELEPLAMLWIELAVRLGLGREIGFGLARRTAGDRTTISTTKQRRSIVIVGTGNIGGALARAWLAAGHRVTLAVRDANAAEVSALVAMGAIAVPVTGAAADSEVVVFAVPAGAVIGIAETLGDLTGKIVVDCTNAIGKGFTLAFGHTTSSGEELAKALPSVRVVRSFNQQGAETLVNPMFSGTRATNFVAADDPEARAIVAELSRDIGLDTIEAGPLMSSRYLEPITLLWVTMAKALGTRELALTLLRRST